MKKFIERNITEINPNTTYHKVSYFLRLGAAEAAVLAVL
jgi:hypothetical protein